MCKNATSQVSNLMAAVRPTLVAIMSVANVPEATVTNVLAAYDAAQAQLANWQPGTTSATLDQALDALLAVVSALKGIIPIGALELLSVAIGGIEAVIGIVGANNATDPVAQVEAAHVAIAKVTANVPGFHESIFEKARAALGDDKVAAGHYKHEWNKAVQSATKVDPKYAALKV
jgi:hypothetical protein